LKSRFHRSEPFFSSEELCNLPDYGIAQKNGEQTLSVFLKTGVGSQRELRPLKVFLIAVSGAIAPVAGRGVTGSTAAVRALIPVASIIVVAVSVVPVSPVFRDFGSGDGTDRTTDQGSGRIPNESAGSGTNRAAHQSAALAGSAGYKREAQTESGQ
jgi:hypothetical protein